MDNSHNLLFPCELPIKRKHKARSVQQNKLQRIEVSADNLENFSRLNDYRSTIELLFQSGGVSFGEDITEIGKTGSEMNQYKPSLSDETPLDQEWKTVTAKLGDSETSLFQLVTKVISSNPVEQIDKDDHGKDLYDQKSKSPRRIEKTLVDFRKRVGLPNWSLDQMSMSELFVVLHNFNLDHFWPLLGRLDLQSVASLLNLDYLSLSQTFPCNNDFLQMFYCLQMIKSHHFHPGDHSLECSICSLDLNQIMKLCEFTPDVMEYIQALSIQTAEKLFILLPTLLLKELLARDDHQKLLSLQEKLLLNHSWEKKYSN